MFPPSTLRVSSPPKSADPAVAESLLTAARAAGGRGATAAMLQLERLRKTPGENALPPRRAALAALINEDRIHVRRDGGTRRFVLRELAPGPEHVGEKILALSDSKAGGSLVLWRVGELARTLASHERPLLDPALARLEERRQLLRVTDGSGGERFLFAEPLRRWLGAAEPAAATPASRPGDVSSLLAVYRRVVRESGGFPDVKISALRRALDPAAAAALAQHLRHLWLDGRVTLSLGDWSLANEEMRQAAVELDGESYLLVRFEQDLADEEFSALNT